MKRVSDDARATADNAKEQAAANKELIDEAVRIIAEAKYEFQKAQYQQKVCTGTVLLWSVNSPFRSIEVSRLNIFKMRKI